MLKTITWVNILFQLLFPLSLSFTPVIAAAQTSKGKIINVTTEPYILNTNENIEIIAKRYGLTVDELKKINNYRTFSKPFSSLTTGDEIDIPRKVSPFSIDNQKNSNTDISLENKLASHAQTGATALATGNAAKSGERMIRSAANNEFNNQVQGWLGQFGTARVQMNLNDDLKLDGSAVDVLVPLYDNQKSMLFTQLGARNKDSRNTVNIGAGVRTFQNDWMYGANTFFDNDMTGKNRRIGVGVEAWTDYLKLSANSYFGTTDWHQSRDFVDYNERPANGYDVRAEAYLPAYPQLGGKLMYEKYRGDEVALFGKDDRQKNPHAVTAGVNYSPIPLLTVGAEHRAGKGSKNDSSINFQFNYRLGESWQSHINPTAVASTRTLAGSRYDLVERNNDIVLDYQKQALIKLTLPEEVMGEALSRATVNALVVSKYGLERVDWDSAGLIAAGGSLTQVSPQKVLLTLPPYQSTRSNNIHTLSAVAHDRQGNTSPRVTMQIVVIPSTAKIMEANLTVVRNNAIANGTETNEVKAIVTDAGNNRLSGHAVSFSADNGSMVTTVIGTTGADGVATATMTNMTAGTTSVKATVNGMNQSVPTIFIPDDSTAQITAANLTVVRNNAIANGTEANEVKAIVTDAGNNPLSGHAVSFSADNGGMVTTVIGTTGADGVATAAITNMTAGDTLVEATVNGMSQSVPTTFMPDDSTAQITAANLTVVRNNAIANGTDANEVKAIVTDAGNNLLSGHTVSFSADNGGMVTTVIGTTGTDGIATATITNMTEGTTSLEATVNSMSQSVPTIFIPDDSTAQITAANLTVVRNNAIANGTEANEVKAIVTDAGNNLLSGHTVSFSANNGGMVTTVIGTTGTDGIATATITNMTAGDTLVEATVNGMSQSVPTTFMPDDSTAQITAANLTVVRNNAIANGTETNEVKAIVTDAGNNLLSGHTVSFSANNGGMVTTVIGTTGTDGIATATITNMTAGDTLVEATVNGMSQSVPTTFMPDDSTAQITAANLTVVRNNAIADGTETNEVKAIVTDTGNNLLSGHTVSFSADNGGMVTTVIGTTGTDGIATATITNMTAGTTSVKATVNGMSQTKGVNFTQVLNIKIETTQNNAISGEESNTVKATVSDKNGNRINNVKVDFTSSESSGITLTPSSGMTNSNGEIVSSVSKSGSIGGEIKITATISERGENDSSLVNFLTLHPAYNVIAPGNHPFAYKDRFPTTGYAGAEFQINASGNIAANTNYTWTSSENASMSVDNEGNVTLTEGNIRNKPVKITARNNTDAYRYEFEVTSWFITHEDKRTGNFNDAQNYCFTQGMVMPKRDQLTKGEGIRGIGSLWSEWQKPKNWSGSAPNTAYWTDTQPPAAPSNRYMVDMGTGKGSEYKTNIGAYLEYISCIKIDTPQIM
ncbi:YrIlm family inverse autotransporter adhesin [Yersinia proxima]|uniref:YrIlm family inverse autotransporter adhesin n=2 Tax=Yersinia proxima TaxID=2890316 RepID=UPI002A4E1996|nr:YrIlm family inverse autotransporter adhesin [Yersinia proxima]